MPPYLSENNMYMFNTRDKDFRFFKSNLHNSSIVQLKKPEFFHFDQTLREVRQIARKVKQNNLPGSTSNP